MPHIASREFEMSPYNAAMLIVDARTGVVQSKPRRTKVAIVGAGVGRDYAPYDDPEWEIWALNSVAPCDRFGRLRADRWFEMHVRAAQTDDDMTWIKRCPVPIYIPPDWANAVLGDRQRKIHPDEDIRTVVRYPLEVVEHRFGEPGYFACSFAYQLALALLEGVSDVGLYGCEVAFGTERERTVEWACISWWLGMAEGRGVNVHLPPQSVLGRHRYRYGIEYYDEKRDVERYVNAIRAGDKVRHVNADVPYDSAVDFSQGG